MGKHTAMSIGLVRRRYRHCVRLEQPENGFGNLAHVEDWLKQTGYPCQITLDWGYGRDRDHLSWRFGTPAEADAFQAQFGGDRWTDVQAAPVPRAWHEWRPREYAR